MSYNYKVSGDYGELLTRLNRFLRTVPPMGGGILLAVLSLDGVRVEVVGLQHYDLRQQSLIIKLCDKIYMQLQQEEII